MAKKIAAEIGCNSFDLLDLQSLNNYIFFLFVLCYTYLQEVVFENNPSDHEP